ncbi:hypothetical protein PRVXT_000459 [Proteinivorax tanatarense]|uniref:Uncharacterized protein n=1 Tax=Proteinivorax tanatarense TaxID=1260629 RepID=A0AAU7VMP4_9FIRM
MFKRFIALFLSLTVLLTSSNVLFANNKSAVNANGKTVYVDGVEYFVSVDEEFNTIVETVGIENQAKLILGKNGNGFITVNNSDIKGYSINNNDKIGEVKVNELNGQNIDAKIKPLGGKNESVHLKNINDLNSATFNEVGVQSVTAGTIIIGGSLLKALLAAGLAITVAGITVYAVESVIDQVRENRQKFYKAYLRRNNVYIAPKPIPRTQAVTRVASGGKDSDVYTYQQFRARSLVESTGYGVSQVENHRRYRLQPGTFFDHYHPIPRNGSHVFFGTPK